MNSPSTPPQGGETKLLRSALERIAAVTVEPISSIIASNALFSTPSSLPIAPDHVLVPRENLAAALAIIEEQDRFVDGPLIDRLKASLTAAPQPPSPGQGERPADCPDVGELYAAATALDGLARSSARRLTECHLAEPLRRHAELFRRAARAITYLECRPLMSAPPPSGEAEAVATQGLGDRFAATRHSASPEPASGLGPSGECQAQEGGQ